MKKFSIIFLFLCLFAVIISVSVSAEIYTDERASFSLKYREYTIPYKLFSIFVLPGEEVQLSIQDPQSGLTYEFMAAEGRLVKSNQSSWTWKAPLSSGTYELIFRSISGKKNNIITLKAFVMIPREKQEGEYLNGYRIGNYPRVPQSKLPQYELPVGFIEVNEGNWDLFVSPHFQLKQFLCKQKSGYPKYIVLKESLLLKLELLLHEINGAGYQASSFHIMSGYRTPFYNKLLGNTSFSRHLWGDAADIFIDENPVDGIMDDLNKDGKNNIIDLRIFYRIIEKQLYGRRSYIPLIGGMGLYERNEVRGPFIHIDARGIKARW